MSLLTSIPYSFRLHSGIKNVFQDPFVDNLETLRKIFFSSAPRGQKFCRDFYNMHICHSWCPKSSKLHSGIKNVFQDPLVDNNLETLCNFFSSSSPWCLKFFTELPNSLYKSFLIHEVHSQLGIMRVLQDFVEDPMKSWFTWWVDLDKLQYFGTSSAPGTIPSPL